MSAMIGVLLLRLGCRSPRGAAGLALLLLLLPAIASAQTLMLIQGFMGDSNNWRDSGITRILKQAGWENAGRLSLDAEYVKSSLTRRPTLRRYYTLDLPTSAPLMVQSRVLGRYISFIRRRHPSTSLVLAGHSAGGVLARLYMVQHPEQNVAALITIASPNLGTESAELGLLAGGRLTNWLNSLLGEQRALKFSWGLLRDLAPERSDNLLGWLNRQPHPPALYTSIVHRQDGDDPFSFGAFLVPIWSQDLNHVAALRGRVKTVVVTAGHALCAADGRVLVRTLERLRQA